MNNASSVTAPQTTTLRIFNNKDYVHNYMATDMADFAAGCKIQSGYANLDAITSIYPGLYTIGAISSLGKTTFIHQMADQVAMQGHPVIYFSLEQSTPELVSKSLSRIMSQTYRDAMTSLQIRKHFDDPRLPAVIEKYDTYCEQIMTVECSFAATIDNIEQVVDQYIATTNRKPLIVVDYLQVIKAPANCRLSSKELVDMHVQRLKQLQDKHKIPMIVISSFNRQNYLCEVDFESFKESGGIEYTADVVWGLQLQALHDSEFTTTNSTSKKRLILQKAKAAIPRRIELVCLKNRFGISSYRCQYNYFPQYDYFRPDLSNSQTANVDTVDPDTITKVPDYMLN